MALHPKVQAQAQAQLDSVIGMKRLPEFDDIASLPYIEAILLEITRWRPVVPLSMYSSQLAHERSLSMLNNQNSKCTHTHQR